MFFKSNKYQEAPLAYWEERSFFSIILDNDSKDILNKVTQRVSKIKGLTILDSKDVSSNNQGYLKVLYNKEIYELFYSPSYYEFYNNSINNNYSFTEEEKEKLRNTHKSIILSMSFNDNLMESYYLELCIAYAIEPHNLGIFDESAERMLPVKWVRMVVESKDTLTPKDLFTVQIVHNQDNRIWLHTHGLLRMGITELEILDSNQENALNHYNLLITYASYLIDKYPNIDSSSGAYIGILSNNAPLVVTNLIWTEALKKYYKKIDLGGIKDRNSDHNTRTSVIFVYKSEEDENNNILSKVTDYDNLLGDNPLYFLSDKETNRMKRAAIDTFSYVRKEFKNKDNKVLIKIGLPTDDNNNSLEHIWFELLELKKDKFKARLTQEPYNVSNFHVGDEAYFKESDITDWIIYTKEMDITPSKIYLLMK